MRFHKRHTEHAIALAKPLYALTQPLPRRHLRTVTDSAELFGALRLDPASIPFVSGQIFMSWKSAWWTVMWISLRRTCARHAAQSLTPSAMPDIDFFEFYSVNRCVSVSGCASFAQTEGTISCSDDI
jgi:hypothetical protein